MNIERDQLSAGLKPIIPDLKRCIVGMPVSARANEQEFIVRVWMNDDGVVGGTTAIRTGAEPLSTWPGAAVRKCIERVFVGRKFTPAGDSPTFLLTFETK